MLDTSITLDNGEVSSLGLTHVARETGKAIQEVTEQRLSEIATTFNQIKPTEDFITQSLSKLAFTMSDRASNEKLADKLLFEWHDGLLASCNDQHEIQTVQHFHCMAHVLLGFHRYVCKDMKHVEKEIVAESGPIGSDNLPVFNFGRKQGLL
ncbi:hypothetical protein DPMN_051730 [Dreissena polymorpha]|uniref:Uncharacterized protein n=1 Tax=Dreissena polymorpha TaxID=45954 RepID=A0A9D4HME1_DREPO|nr:hypothetical protein DPMN_051730 [Dreissena polymorpha]